jgi:3-methyladenine DNA glycosylase AlkD
MAAYMKDQFEFLGLKAKERRRLAREYKKIYDYFSLEDIEQDAKEMWSLDEREFQYIYLDFLKKHKKKLTEDSIEVIEYLIINKSWWDTVDLIATHLVGELFKKYPYLIEKYHKKWQNSNNIWLQRSLILFQLKYKEATDETLLFAIINENLGSEEFFINKAIGWSLREYSKTNKDAVSNFVRKTNLSNLSKREASKYL